MINSQLIEIPTPVTQKLENYFVSKDISAARRFIQLSHVSISFSKGDLESYCITSGIVRDNRAHECKFVYKSRFENTQTPPLSSNCDCHAWSEQTHCPHVCALFMAYILQSISDKSYTLDESLYPPVNINTTMGVMPGEYGTIINAAHQLQGAPSNATYSSLQYLLQSKKIVNFPIPEPLEGKLIIKVNSSHRVGEQDENQNIIPAFRFARENESGKEIKEISLLENLYLFDWKSGKAFHLSRDLKTFIQKIRFNQSSLEVNEFIRYFHSLDLGQEVILYIDGVLFENIPRKPVLTRLAIAPSERKNYLRLTLNFYDDEEKLLPPPGFLSLFTFTGGQLSGFKKKRDAYDFIIGLTNYFENGNEGYKTLLHSTNKKSIWTQNIKYISEASESTLYDGSQKKLCIYDNKFMIKFLSIFTSAFGETSFRFSHYVPEMREIHFDLSANILLQGLSKVHSTLSPYGLSIFYNKKEISKWKSRIRFERRKSSTQWFDLDLSINQHDLEIIRNSDLDSGMVLTKDGLVMLTNEQKDLIRFMKKYTKYESTQIDQANAETSAKTSEEEKAEAAQELMQEEDITKFKLPFHRARIFELFELKKLGIEGALTEEEEQLCHRLATLEEIPEYQLNDQLNEIMRPYQKTGYNWLRFLYENKLGACLADDMGLGKTLQVISFLESIHEQVNRVLIVCPVSILLNWEKEVKKFSNLDIFIYHGGGREFPTDQKIILTSYGVMKKEIDDTFIDKEFDIFILDEVQHLKNIRSLGAYAARKLKANFRICLTGTPVENDLAEFYNILDLSVPGIWGDLQFIRTSSNKKSRLLARKTSAPFILRRTKAQVLNDLPPKIENNIYLNLSDAEKEHYENSLNNIRNKIALSPTKKKYGEILKGLLELRQSCLWQKTQNEAGVIKGVDSTKINFLTETLEQILEEGHQAIVFSQFTSYLDIIQTTLREKHWKIARIDGSQSIKKRQQQVDVFQEGEASVFLISLKAGGVGLNLTAASYVFVMDPWWNPAVEAQAIDRAHRIGQKNTLTVYRPIIKGSVEEKVLELQEMKKQLFYDLLPEDEEQLFTGKLSMKDFEHLLS